MAEKERDGNLRIVMTGKQKTYGINAVPDAFLHPGKTGVKEQRRWKIKMKKFAVSIITLLMTVSLYACGSFPVSQKDAADDAETTLPSAEEPAAESVPGDLAGPWHLDGANNDLKNTAVVFAGYEEWGAAMEIGSDGKISWYIGAIGGSGTYTLDGDALTVFLRQAIKDAASGPQDWTMHFRLITADGGITLAMEYADTEVIWSYGEAAGCTGKEEGWKTDFEASLLEQYGVVPDRYEDLGDGIYQVYVIIDGRSVPYVTVNSATGDYHG